MSLINFLSAKLKPTVSCESVCEDGYEPSNLISANCSELANGFQAYSVIKPPVHLEFEFQVDVNVKQIKLWNSLRSFRSTGLEVFVQHDGGFDKVAEVKDFQGDSILFCCSKDQNSTVSSQTHEKILFFKNAAKALAATSRIRVTIRSTSKCPPVLKRIEVWGTPARSVPSPDRELIRNTWREVVAAKREKFFFAEPEVPLCAEGDLSPKQVPEEFPVPEDFLDAITCELMMFPSVLPSGKIVDQSTIDRHSNHEAQWGRSPSDPFTGVGYTRQRKPVLDLSLKARIEKFLIDNAEHFKTVPRTLGHRNAFKRRSTSTETSAKKHKSEYLPSYVFGSHPLASLEDALAFPLKKVTRYTRLPEEDFSKPSCCVSCQHLDNLYRIKTCKHLLCRNCLNNFTITKACSCKVRFSTADVEKFHA